MVLRLTDEQYNKLMRKLDKSHDDLQSILSELKDHARTIEELMLIIQEGQEADADKVSRGEMTREEFEKKYPEVKDKEGDK